MSKEQDIVVSGVMFLVAIQAYQQLSIMNAGKILGMCSPSMRFVNALVAATLIAAISLSTIISFIYFRNFSKKICEPFLGDEGEEE